MASIRSSVRETMVLAATTVFAIRVRHDASWGEMLSEVRADHATNRAMMTTPTDIHLCRMNQLRAGAWASVLTTARACGGRSEAATDAGAIPRCLICCFAIITRRSALGPRAAR